MKTKLLFSLLAALFFLCTIPVKADTPFHEDFEGAAFPPTGWTVYSLLDQAQNWELNLWQNITPGGTQSAFHSSTPWEESVDNWLVTPQLSIAADGFHYLSIWSYLANSWSYKSNTVLISTGSPDPADDDYVVVWDNASDLGNAWVWMNYFVDLTDYIGQNIYVAFRYEGDTWGHTWNIDDVSLVDDSPIFNINVTEISQVVGFEGTGTTNIEISNGGIQDLTFEIELDFLNSNGWLVVDPINGSVASQAVVEIALSFDAEGLDFGTYQANLNITTNDTENPTATVLVTFEVVNVNVYPFTEDFESETFPPLGWAKYDLDGDGTVWALSWYNHTPGGQFSALHSWSWDSQDGWLVTPKISVPEEGFFYLSFWSYVGESEYYDKNSVLISTGSGNPNDDDFVEVWTVSEVSESWGQHFIDIEEFAGQDIYIAFRYEGEYAHFWAIDDVSLGEEIDVEPVMFVSAEEIQQVVGQDGSGTKSFKVINDGVQNLTYEIEINFIDSEDWLSVTPESGSIPAKSSNTITLTFDATGLDLGQFQAEVVVSGNDAVNPTHTVVATLTVMEAQNIDFTVIFPEYTFPTAISSDGRYVSGSQFGGLVGYLWTKDEGRIDAPGEFMGVADNGHVAGTYDSEFTIDGLEVYTAGLWNPNTQEWEFLGMHPDVPEIFGTFYNTGYGITADGSVVVGMQWYPDWTVRAFKWTAADGYDMIGPVVDYNTRANGISSNGSVIYGWAEPNWTRTPVIWYNDEMIFIDNTQFGEASGSSPGGNYVTGGIGVGGFIWSPAKGTTFFENTLNSGFLNPQVVLDDGTVFGYTSEGFPPTPDLRRAFVRYPDGAMETFNEYAAARGWFEAADWIFFSINDVTPDGNVFIGAAELPGGEWISFVVDFNPETPVATHSLILLVNPENTGTVTGAGEYEEGTTVTVNAFAHEGYEFVNWTDASDNMVSEVAENEITITGDITLIANFMLVSNVEDVWENQLTVYPNPASDILSFMSSDNIRNLEVFNITGQKVFGTQVNHNQYKLDVSALPQGFYLVKLTNMAGDIHTTRILIAR